METGRQYCRKCQADRPIDAFEEGFYTCTRCRDKDKKRYNRKRETILENKKEYREREKAPISKKNKGYFQSMKDIVITCPLCNYDIKNYKKSQHEKSQFHQDNMARQLKPDMEALPEPDEIKVVDGGKKKYYCYACKCCMMCWEWKKHVHQQSHIEATKKNEAEKQELIHHNEIILLKDFVNIPLY